jgi:hypothetical protein
VARYRAIAWLIVVMPLNIIAAQDTRRAAIEHYQSGSKAFVEQNFDAAIIALTRTLMRRSSP